MTSLYIEREEIYGRGTRYDIIADDMVIFSDVCEDDVDRLCEQLERKHIYEKIEVIEH